MASPHLSVRPAPPRPAPSRPASSARATRRPRVVGRVGTAVLLAAAGLAVAVLPGVANAAPDATG